MRVKIEVTQQDIDEGCRYNGMSCPIAIAISRLIRSDLGVDVAPNMIYIHETEERPVATAKMPRKAEGFATRFDMGALVEPFSFTISLPKSILK